MSLRLIEAISAPGRPGTPNDDAYAAGESFAAVLDGCTALAEPLLDGPSDPAWFASLMADSLARRADKQRGRDLLAACLSEAEEAYVSRRRRAPAETYEWPMASLMLLEALGDDRWAAHWFGDCTAVLAGADGSTQVIGDAFEMRAREAAQAARLQPATTAAVRVDPLKRSPEALAALRASRNRYNADEGPWILAPDPRCAEHARTATVFGAAGGALLLATDGFLALCTDYGRYDAAGLVAAAREKGLRSLLSELRAIEEGDVACAAYPRHKPSDDATALLLEIV